MRCLFTPWLIAVLWLLNFLAAADAAPIVDSAPGEAISGLSVPEQMPEIASAIESFQAGRIEECLRHLEAARKKRASLSPPKVTLAKLFFSANRVPQGRLALEQAVIESGSDPEVYLLFAKLALLEGQLTSAELQLNKAASLAPPAAWSDEQKRALKGQCYSGLAAVAEQRRNWKSAVEWLEKALALNAKDSVERRRLARALFASAQAQAAYKQLQQASQDDPAIDPAPVMLASLYANEGQDEQARKWFDFAVKTLPNDPRVYLAYAGWLFLQGDGHAAQQQVDAAQRAGADVKSRDYRVMAGAVARLQKDDARAEQLFQQAFDENPNDADVVNQLALSLVEQDDKEKRQRALQMAELNARQYPRNGEVLATLGWVYYRLDRKEDAERVLRTAISGGQATYDTIYFLAVVLADRGADTKEVKSMLTAAVGARGRFVFRKDAEALLAKLK